jgi:ketosteroid isomerase-like protein
MGGATSELVRAYFEAYATGDVDAVAAFWDPEIEWRAAGGPDGADVVQGCDAMRRYAEGWIDAIGELRADVVDVLFEDDERVAVKVVNSGLGRVSGVPVGNTYYVACLIRDGRILAGHEYLTAEHALEGVQALD